MGWLGWLVGLGPTTSQTVNPSQAEERLDWLIGWLVWVKPGCVSVNPSLVELAGVAGWLAGRFGSDQAGSCVLTQSVYPSQVALGWFGWPVAWLVGGWLVGWLVGWFGPDQAGWCVLPHSVNPSQVELGWLVVGPRWFVFFGTICQSESSRQHANQNTNCANLANPG